MVDHYNNPRAVAESDPIDKENWRRSNHILNLLTYGQILCDEGEKIQNPKIISDGVSIMLENIGPMIVEKVKLKDETGKTIQEKILKGQNTHKFRLYYEALSEAKTLINICMNNPRLSNKAEILNRSYQILSAMKYDLLQDAADMGMNFKQKINPSDLFLEQKK